MGYIHTVICSLPLCVVGEPAVHPIYAATAAYVSPPIGLGPDGGTISGSVVISEKDPFAINVFHLLSEPQYLAWQDSLSESSPDDVDTNARIAQYSKPFGKSLDFSLRLRDPQPQRYYVVVAFPSSKSDDTDLLQPSGLLTVDWVQADGKSFLQYQFHSLGRSVRIILNLLGVFLAAYVGILLLGARNVNKLHYFYLATLVFTIAFLISWSHSIELESATGDRSSWASKWVPSLYQKGFDILEVLVYVFTALGWQTMRPAFAWNEIQMISVGSFMSFMLGVFEIACGDDELECGSYTSARMIIHMFGFLTAIVAFNYQIAFLTAHVGESSIAAVETGKLYTQLNQFYYFRIVFLLFIVQPTIAVVVRADILNWEDDYLFIAFFWVTKISLICAVALTFRPRDGRMPIVDLAIKERRRSQRENRAPIESQRENRAPTEVPAQ